MQVDAASAYRMDDLKLVISEGGAAVDFSTAVEKDFTEYGGNKEAAHKVGETLAKRAIEKGIEECVFDRSGYIYHGRVAELADGARAGGLKF